MARRQTRAQFNLDRYTYGGEVWRAQDQPHHVYVLVHVQGGSLRAPIKVGHSYGPFARLKEIQAGNPYELAVYYHIEVRDKFDARTLEREFHEAFAADRMRGEWFNVDPGVASEWLENYLPKLTEKAA